MRSLSSKQVVRIRSLARALRRHARETAILEYRRKFEHSAAELDRAADRLDAAVRFNTWRQMAS
jgi:hypothetical protein